MENSYPRTRKSVDELAAYIAYALKILKNCDLPCEGITTPGEFRQSWSNPNFRWPCTKPFVTSTGAELPHYFKYVIGDDREHVRAEAGARPRASSTD